jgi:hypothetical protein
LGGMTRYAPDPITVAYQATADRLTVSEVRPMPGRTEEVDGFTVRYNATLVRVTVTVMDFVTAWPDDRREALRDRFLDMFRVSISAADDLVTKAYDVSGNARRRRRKRPVAEAEASA